MSEWWWLSSERMTIAVAVSKGAIVEAPPIARRFIGQSSYNLGRWMRGHGGFRAEKLA